MCVISHSRLVPLPTGDQRARSSSTPSTLRSSDSRWYCSRACRVSASPLARRGGLRSAMTAIYAAGPAVPGSGRAAPGGIRPDPGIVVTFRNRVAVEMILTGGPGG